MYYVQTIGIFLLRFTKKKEVESELLYQFLSIVSNFALKWYKRKRMMIHLKKYVAYSNNWYFLAQIFEDKKIDNEFVVCMKRQTMTNPFFCMGSRFVVWVFFLRRLMVQVNNLQRVPFLYHGIKDFERIFSYVESVK